MARVQRHKLIVPSRLTLERTRTTLACVTAALLAVAALAVGMPAWRAVIEARAGRLAAVSASWQSVGGCGAGSSTGIGGIKWVGRNVSGGLFNVQCQLNYTGFDDGYAWAVQNQITGPLDDRWNLGVMVPYLYKYLVDPAGFAELGMGFDVSNQGVGDVNLMLGRKFGPIGATTVTGSLGLPTGTYDAQYAAGQPLRQDRQLGVGTISGGLLVDHVMDNLWGPSVLGGTLVYPGAENLLENYRAPSASAYSYAGYLLGPLVPALGISATYFLGKDRDRGLPSDERPAWLVSANASLEWSNDWLALLVGLSLPYHSSGLQPYTLGAGLALSPF